MTIEIYAEGGLLRMYHNYHVNSLGDKLKVNFGDEWDEFPDRTLIFRYFEATPIEVSVDSTNIVDIPDSVVGKPCFFVSLKGSSTGGCVFTTSELQIQSEFVAIDE